jgi:hypothetical protein
MAEATIGRASQRPGRVSLIAIRAGPDAAPGTRGWS